MVSPIRSAHHRRMVIFFLLLWVLTFAVKGSVQTVSRLRAGAPAAAEAEATARAAA